MARMLYRTADPVADAERYAEDDTPTIGICDNCGHEIHVWEDAYRVDAGLVLHEDCLLEYARKHWGISGE